MTTDPHTTPPLPNAHARARSWLWLLAITAGLLALPIYYSLPPESVEQSAFYDLIGLAVVVGAVAGLLMNRPRGMTPWALMIAGQLAFVAGDILWTLYSAWGEDPFPSIADVAYISGYPLIAVGLAVAIRRRLGGGDKAGVLDGAILAIGAGICWWTVVLGPLSAVADTDPLSFAISLAYPVGDLLLIGIALALTVTPGARGASFWLLLGSLVATLGGDLVFSLQTLEGSYVDGTWVDALWLAGYVLFAAAALHPSMTDLVEPRPTTVATLGSVRLAFLGVAMLVGPGLLLLERALNDAVLVVAVATAALSVLVLARLAVMVRHLDRDIERRKALEAQLAFQAYHDPLTGLANRRRFIAAVTEALQGTQRAAVLFLDLDDFKHVNDRRGHDAGDALLRAVGERIVATVRPSDVVSRLGGDEFSVLLSPVDGSAVAEAISARLIDVLGQRVAVDGEDVAMSASIGIALADPGEGLVTDELLRRADVAMYHAKARGKNGWMTFRPEMDIDAAANAAPLVRRPAPAA